MIIIKGYSLGVIPSEISKFFTFFPVLNSDFVETFTECLFNIVIVVIKKKINISHDSFKNILKIFKCNF